MKGIIFLKGRSKLSNAWDLNFAPCQNEKALLRTLLSKWESQMPLAMVRNGKVNVESTRIFRQIEQFLNVT